MKTTIVPSGEFAVTFEKREVLTAYLGTCVGLTLVDRTNKIGGLAHFLLPEPIGTDPGWQPACYASRGLPIFFSKMLEAGAKKDDLEATIAGGALLGPVSPMDLTLDIGGRTTEWVIRFLMSARVPVLCQETGGYHTCRMCLNSSSLETSIDQMAPSDKSSAPGCPPPTWAEIDKSIHHLRPIPQVVLKLIRETNWEGLNLDKVVHVLNQDQVLTGRILKFCNSSAFPLALKVDSLPLAATLIGGRELRRLAIASAMNMIYEKVGKGYSLCQGGLFQHALGTARAALQLALFTQAVHPDLAYTAGLLHDIGKVVLDQYVASEQPFFYRATQIESNDLCALESSRFGLNHTEAGERLSQQWKLPANLAAAIRYHHNPEEAGEHNRLVTLVHLADLVMSRFQVGLEIDQISTERLSDRLRLAGLSPDQLPRLAEVALRTFPEESIRSL